VGASRPGEPLRVELVRGGQPVRLEVTLGEMPLSVLLPPQMQSMVLTRLGVWSISAGELPRIDRVWSGSPAERAGLGEGVEIERVAGKRVSNWSEAMFEMVENGLLEGRGVPLTVRDPGGNSRSTTIVLDN